MIKFPTYYEVRELRGNQVATHECYIAMLEMDDHQQTMCIEEQRAIAEPIKEPEEVTLDESKPERMTRMGTFSNWTVQQALTTFLKDNQDVFACSHVDMPRIDPLVIVHSLNVSPSSPPI